MDGATRHDPDLAAYPREPVESGFMAQRWTDVCFVHVPVDASSVQDLLPPGLTVDTFDGSAWIGLVAFNLSIRMPARAPALPWLASTSEVNTRTYVRGPDGRPGIWFLSLDAGRLAVVAAARAWYQIPYRWARATVGRTAWTYECRCRRRSSGARFDASVRAGAPVAEPDEITGFLVNRWRLYSPRRRGGLSVSRIDHEPWPLRRGQPEYLSTDLVEAAGLRPAGDRTLVHVSPGVDVRWMRRARPVC